MRRRCGEDTGTSSRGTALSKTTYKARTKPDNAGQRRTTPDIAGQIAWHVAARQTVCRAGIAVHYLHSVRITTSVTIEGMLAVHAAHAVYTALAGVDGILTADVKVGRATIEHDGRATHEQIIGAIGMAGCRVTEIRDERRLPRL